MAIDFTPKPQMPKVTQMEQKPTEAPIGSPAWVRDTWRELYYMVPSDGLAKRVKETDRWAAEQSG